MSCESQEPSGIRKPLNSKSLSECNAFPTSRKPHSSRKLGPGNSNVERKVATSAAAALSSGKDRPLPCPLALDGGFTIRLHRHGVPLKDRQTSHSDDALPAGFFSSSGPSSLIRGNRELSTIFPSEELYPRDSDGGNARAAMGRYAGSAETYGFVLRETPSVECNRSGAVASGTGRVSKLANGALSDSNFAPNKENETRIRKCETMEIENVTRISKCQSMQVEKVTRISKCQSMQVEKVASISKCQSMHVENVTRISKSQSMQVENNADEPPLVRSLQKKTVLELKEILLNRGLSTTGIKATLITRVEEALSSEKLAGKGVNTEYCKARETSRRRRPDAEHANPSERTVKSMEIQANVVDKSTAGDAAENEEVSRMTTGSKFIKSRKRKCSTDLVTQSCEDNHDVPMTAASAVKVSTRTTRSMANTADKVPASISNTKKELLGPTGFSSQHPSLNESCVDLLATPDPAFGEPVMDPVSSGASLKECPAPESHKVTAVKAITKRIKINEPNEENSWANPKILRKAVRARKVASSKVCKPQRRLCETSGERNNFVRLNINGKGRGRKFLNKSRSRRPGAYGRRGNRGSKFKKYEKTVAVDVAHGDGGDEVQYDGPKAETRGRRGGDGTDSLWAHDGWLETSTSPESTAPFKCDEADPLPDEVNEVVHTARQNPSDENLAHVLNLVFGFKTFRTGQLEAIKRVLSLQSTMVILPTGAGKSLCYQLPAYMLPGITLVVSPLVALMTDQLLHLPPTLPGALISSAQTSQESSTTISRLRAGQVKVLFISPERLFSQSFLSILGELPNISLAVIDEAHCLSEWSHNFRPSYFRLGKVLHEQIKVSCVLAMTATATKKAETSIMKSLCIPDDGVVQESHMRQNLQLSVSKADNRLRCLLSMLQNSPYAGAKSIIIYCTFQMEADNISGFLQQNGIQAKSYHAKKTSQERNRIYELFCRNKLRVVVATVAFGMGLDKSDVRAIVHYNMPRSLEHYVQETGRAGRDGDPAYCHLFLDDGDYLKLRSLSYSDGVDEYSVNRFLTRVFEGCSASTVPGKTGSIIIETASREFDMKEEVMETILSFLEVGDVEYVKVLSKLNATCKLSFHQSNPASLAQRNTLVAAIMRRSRQVLGLYVFDLPTIASHLQFSLFRVQYELRRLQTAGEISYELGDPALCFEVLHIPKDICFLTSTVAARLAQAEQCQVRKIDSMYVAASSAIHDLNGEKPHESSSSLPYDMPSLQTCINLYFKDEECCAISNSVPSIVQSKNNSFLQADIKVFLSRMQNPNLTGRAVARIFHGLWSPAFSYSEWSKHHLWGQHSKIDFRVIQQAASAEIVKHHVNNPNLFHH